MFTRVKYAFVTLILGCFATAFGQTVTVNPTQLTFNVPPGVSSSTSQVVTVTTDQGPNYGGSGGGTISYAVNTGLSPWLRVNNTTSGTITLSTASVDLLVNVSTVGLLVGQVYSGSFTVSTPNTGGGGPIPGAPGAQKTVNITLIVGTGGGGGGGNLSATPSSMSFSAVPGSQVATPASQNLTIFNNTASVSFVLFVQTTSGGSWLRTSASTGVTGSGSATVAVSVNPTGLGQGTYNGTITAQSNTGDATQISVVLTIATTSTLTVTPTAPSPFLFQVNGSNPPAQTLSIGSSGGAVAFTIAANPGAPWLSINPSSGTAAPSSPSVISLSVSPMGFPTGTYTGSVVITPLGGNPLPSIPITLIISNNAVLQVVPNSLSFTSQFGGPSPLDQVLSITTDTGTTAFTAVSDSPWLTVALSASSTPSQATVHVNPNGLAGGTYNGKITVRPANGDNYSVNIPVTLAVSSTAQVTAAPSTLLFSFQTNQFNPASQSVQVRSSGAAAGNLGVTPVTFSCGSNWLSASLAQNTTPATLTVTVAPAGLPAGSCSGSIAISSGGGPVTQLPVTVAVGNTAVLTISQPLGFGNESVQQGGAGFTRSLSLASTDAFAAVDFTASSTTSNGGAWLTVSPASGVTPQNILVTIFPGALAQGTYGGTIAITSTSLTSLPNRTFLIPVTLVVGSSGGGGGVTVTPRALSFVQTQGGQPPASQAIALAGGGTFFASVAFFNGNDWLDVNPLSGDANRTLFINVKPNSLPASATPYNAQITLTFPNSLNQPVSIPVSLTVTGGQNLSITPQILNFTYQQGGSQPAFQRLTVTSSGAPVPFLVGTTSSPNGWLVVDANGGITPKDVLVSVIPQNLSIGTYNGTVSIAGSAAGVLLTANVTLTVTSGSTQSGPQVAIVTNAASNTAGPIAPGELITIKGTGLGPISPPNGGRFFVNAQGRVDPILFGVRVLFDGIPGTPIFISQTQVNAIAPWEIAGRTTVNLVVEYQGATSPPLNFRVSDVAPGIFTVNSTGIGLAVAANQDGSQNGPNGPGRPAANNSVIALYLTGGGQTSPTSTTGSVNPTNQLLRVNGFATATIGGQPAIVEFIGEAPGLINGVMQANLRVPFGVSGNALPVVITIGGVPTTSGPTVAVQ